MSKEIDVGKHHVVPTLNDSWSGFRQEIERLFDRFSEGYENISLKPFTRMQKPWSLSVTGFTALAVDVSEDDKAYNITAECPGVDEKDIEVTVDDGLLLIHGEKHQEKEEKGRNRYLCERSYGAFQRSFILPHGTDAADVKASFHNGVLTVTVPKAIPSQDSRKVEVKAA
jgi:HSP20 family protein